MSISYCPPQDSSDQPLKKKRFLLSSWSTKARRDGFTQVHRHKSLSSIDWRRLQDQLLYFPLFTIRDKNNNQISYFDLVRLNKIIFSAPSPRDGRRKTMRENWHVIEPMTSTNLNCAFVVDCESLYENERKLASWIILPQLFLANGQGLARGSIVP